MKRIQSEKNREGGEGQRSPNLGPIISSYQFTRLIDVIKFNPFTAPCPPKSSSIDDTPIGDLNFSPLVGGPASNSNSFFHVGSAFDAWHCLTLDLPTLFRFGQFLSNNAGPKQFVASFKWNSALN